MPYIGNTIRAADDYRLIDDISSSFNGSATSFALQVAGSAPVPFPKSPQQVLISVNGVIQEPDPTGASGFNLVGTNIVFSSAPTNGHAFFGIIYATADYLNSGGNFPSGSTGSPSLTFIGDEDTGIYRKGSGSIGFVSNSTEIANTDSNGITISSGNLILGDSSGTSDDRIKLGASGDLEIYHDGSNSYVVDQGTGGLIIQGSQTSIRNTSGHTQINANDDVVELYYDNSKKFETTSSGVSVTGNIVVSGTVDSVDLAALSSTVSGKLSNVVEDTTPQLGGNLDCNNKVVTLNDSSGTDNNRFKIGNAGDLQIFHNGTDSFLQNNTGTLKISTAGGSDQVQINKGTVDEHMAKFIADGAVELYHNNVKKFETTSAGIDVTGRVTADDLTIENTVGNLSAFFTATNGLGTLEVGGSTGAFIDLKTPASDDFDIRYDASGTITSKGNIQLNVAGNESGVHVTANGAVDLYHNNVKKLATDDNRGVLLIHNHGGNEPLCQAAAKGAFHCGFIVDPDAGSQGHFRFARAGSLIAQIRNIADTTQLSMYFFNTNKEHDFFNNGDCDFDGHVKPKSDNSYNLGASNRRWANLYTTDLKLSNEGSQNDVDATWGNYTIQEGHEDLFLINHRTGKKFKFNLTEVA